MKSRLCAQFNLLAPARSFVPFISSSMGHVFISYASQDKARVQRLVDVLQRQGLEVWWDKSIPPGRNFDEVIEEALIGAKGVIVVWSNQSVLSKWVKVEATEADSRNVLVPVLFDDVRIPLEFRRIQAARLIDWDGTPTHPEMVKLLKSVQSLLAAKDTTLAVKPSPAAGSPPRLGWLTGFVTDYFAGRSLWSVRLAVSVAFLASVLLLLLSNKVCMGDYWLRVGSWILEDKVFVTVLYSLVAGAYLWSALVLFVVSAASDPRYKSIAAIAVVGLMISSLPLYWFSREREIYEFPWVTRTKMAVVCIIGGIIVAGFLGFFSVRLKRSR